MSIKVYTTPTCPYCGMVKKYLDSKGVDYESLDVSSDKNAATEMVEKTGQRGVPVVDINGGIVVGFDRDKIDALI